MRFATPLVTLLALGLGLPAAADPDFDHYQGEVAQTTGQAVANLLYYNAKVREVLARGDLDDMDIEEIHEYTYSMEVALAKLVADFGDMAVTLEALHLATETYNADAVRGIAAVYFETADALGR
jgi:hypothetical protein